MTLLAALLASLLQTAQAPAAAPSAPPSAGPAPCATPAHREFDFWIGHWDVVDPQGKFLGSNRIERVGDCFLQEAWSSSRGGYTGRSLNSIGADGRWHQTWTDTSGLRLELAGGLKDGKMVLEGDTPPADPKSTVPTRNRITWSREPGGGVRQLWESSADAGQTWTPAFDGRYHPAQASAGAPDGFFGTLAGAWIGSGSVNKRESHVELVVERGVARTVRLHWRNVMAGERRALFEGMAVYEPKGESEYTATWWDSQGSKHPIAATVSADRAALTALWGDSGKTVYARVDGGALEVVDSIKRPDGSWTEFGRTTLRRQSVPAP